MTQEGLEEIFIQYAQTIEAFRPVKSLNPFDDIDNDIGFFDDDENQGDDLWVAEDTLPPTNLQAPLEQQQSQDTNSDESVTSTIFSQPNAAISNESMNRPRIISSDKPLPANPNLSSSDTNQVKRLNGNRMSWKSDTGIVSGAVSQNLANELMNLFDMDFEVDIKLDTAPKLPELPFKPKRKSQHIQSHDMLSSLLPEFEKIAIQNSGSRATNPILKSVPQRSSSLRYRQEFENAKIQSSPPPPVLEPPFRKRRTLLRFTSFIKHHKEPNFNYNKQLPASPLADNHPGMTMLRKTSTSTNESSATSISSSSLPETPSRLEKPLPAIPQPEKHYSRRRSSRKFKSSKHKSLQDTESESSKSFIKIGLKKSHIRRTVSAKNLNVEPGACCEEQSFVKKMASFHWHKKPHKSVEV